MPKPATALSEGGGGKEREAGKNPLKSCKVQYFIWIGTQFFFY